MLCPPRGKAAGSAGLGRPGLLVVSSRSVNQACAVRWVQLASSLAFGFHGADPAGCGLVWFPTCRLLVEGEKKNQTKKRSNSDTLRVP